MAKLCSIATGNLTSSSTWGTIFEGGTGVPFLSANTAANVTALTTSYVASQTSTPGAITVDRIAFRLAVRSTTTGTISCAILQGGSAVSGAEVTINTADLLAAVTNNDDGGWIVFKFASPVLLVAATAYTLGLKVSSASSVSAFRSSTAGDWARFIVTTTTATPTTGDDLFVAGEHTGAGTGNDITVTMNSTSATDYGSTPSAANAAITPCCVAKRGILTYGNTAATNYVLRLSNSLAVYLGGVLNIGTTGSPIPRDGTAVLEFDPGADGDYGLIVHGTWVAQGLSRTSGKNVTRCLLTANAAANATSLTVGTDTGWLDNDEICITGTDQVQGAGFERGALNGNAASGSLTVDGFAGTGGGLAAAKTGTSPTQAMIGLLTRNVKVRSTSSTTMAYVYVGPQGTADVDWVEFYYLGENVSPKFGITCASANANFNFCSLYECEDGGFRVEVTCAPDICWDNGICYRLSTVNGPGFSINSGVTTGTVFSSADSLMCAFSTSGGVNINRGNINITGMRIANSQLQFMLDGGLFSGTMSNIEINSSNNSSFCALGPDNNLLFTTGTFTNLTLWRNQGTALQISGVINGVIDGLISFENGGSNLQLGAGQIDGLIIKNGQFYGGSVNTSTFNVRVTRVQGLRGVRFEDCTFSTPVAAVNKEDITMSPQTSGRMFCEFEFINCLFTATTDIGGLSTLVTTDQFVSSINFMKYDQTANDHRTYTGTGKLTRDTTISRTASPSMRMAPSSASAKLFSAPPKRGYRFAVVSGATATVSVYVRKSATGSGDAATYNGAQPRLILRRAPEIGQASNAVLATAAGAAGSFEQLTATVPPSGSASADGVYECYVDCDGTTGWVNVDDWSVT